MKNVRHTIQFIIPLLCVTHLAFAHTKPGSLGAKTTGAAATDVYVVGCYDDQSGPPAKLYAHVIDIKEKSLVIPRISTQVIKNNSLTNKMLATGLSTDEKDGDGNYSPGISLAGRGGDYIVTVNKEAAATTCKTTATAGCKGVDNYVLEYHCETAKGSHTGTEEAYSMQNQ